jgi:Peroxidase, family 2
MTLIGGLALFSPAKPDGISFDLNDLREHNFPIEHDASLSRQDYYNAHDDLDFYTPNYDEFISHFAGKTVTSLDTSAAARFQRVNASLEENPTVVYGPEGLRTALA